MEGFIIYSVLVRTFGVVLAGWVLLAAAIVTTRFDTTYAENRARSEPTRLTLTDGRDLRAWDETVDAMTRAGSLHRRREDVDHLVPGRVHERLDQYYKGVRVFGADLTRQMSASTTVSLFGTVHTDVDLDVEPALSVEDAAAVIKRESGIDLGPARMPQLIILPIDRPTDDGYRLVYRAKVFMASGAVEYFIDAQRGTIVQRMDGLQRQVAVGRGTGVLGDTKKMSARQVTGSFLADDLLRPPFLTTFDMRENIARTIDFLNGAVTLNLPDVASDTNNDWTDRAVVDAHAYAGYVYDYYFKRFGRRGLDNNDFEMTSLVHPVARSAAPSASDDIFFLFYVNAFYAGDGIMVYGEGLPPGSTLGGRQWNFLSGALDVVGHELTHGVTDFTSGLIYQNESGALNEAFSDMMATAIEFYFQAPGTGALRADYLLGEDVVTPGGLRSMSNPAAFGDPDHYSKRLVVTPPTEANDNGGVHTNAGIGIHAYYLAIEGGTNRTSGLAVQGVGQANREQIEKVMYRAFTQMMPANATYAVARAVTIQSARDLYGANSAAERAVVQAWTAVGVN